jgi:hypothetical protein
MAPGSNDGPRTREAGSKCKGLNVNMTLRHGSTSAPISLFHYDMLAAITTKLSEF